MSDLSDLQAKLGYTFTNPMLALSALTHKSWVQEGGVGPDQERLEFLGDAFLGYAVAKYLYESRENDGPGLLTPKRAAQVQGATLTRVAEKLGLGPMLRLGVGAKAQLALNKKVLEDSMEALIGAVLVDGTEADAQGVIERLLLVDMDLSVEPKSSTSVYNERWSKLFREAPPKASYRFDGPEDSRTWWATVMMPGGRTMESEASRSKAAARLSAHTLALKEWPAEISQEPPSVTDPVAPK